MSNSSKVIMLLCAIFIIMLVYSLFCYQQQIPDKTTSVATTVIFFWVDRYPPMGDIKESPPYCMPAKRVITDPGKAQLSQVETALRCLLKGPSNEEKTLWKYYTAIPQGTKLNYVKWDKKGVLHIDFSKEINDYGGGSANVRMITEQLEKTIKDTGLIFDEITVTSDGGEALQP